MSQYEFLTLVTSLLAIVVSLISLVRTRKIAQEQLELERVTAELSKVQLRNLEEENKAKNLPKFNVTIQRLGKNSFFYITNTGQGTAYNLNLELVNCPENPLYDIEHKLPHPEMKPNSRVKLNAAFHMQSPLKYEAKLTWEDAEGNSLSENFWLTR
ncbi:hypothetical protein BCU22_010035 [Vibrio cyclitrophicus]|uniref:hypothetical protein n=1 Tax=Vibrio cyclitrophicus TaxID=47951 RepID=UPI000C82CEBD|nr:hypothetical protein [Vibrio cyclitrophicus]PMJ40008.1 hypothetical protein BCU22_13620 [Vibrio cyclitrophicus]